MRIAKWGTSLAVRLPKKLVDEMGLKPGDEIDVVKAEGNKLAIEKIDRREQFLKAMEQFCWSAPEDYRFGRDEADEQ
jgi:antitoxin MazE